MPACGIDDAHRNVSASWPVWSVCRQQQLAMTSVLSPRMGQGTVGSARNYVGFMVTGVAAAGCLKGVEWAVGVLRRREAR